jgi:hypothetical protein
MVRPKRLAPALACALILSATAAWGQSNTAYRSTDVVAGKSHRLGVYGNVQKDCTSGLLPTVRVVTPPKHGELNVRSGKLKAGRISRCPRQGGEPHREDHGERGDARRHQAHPGRRHRTVARITILPSGDVVESLTSPPTLVRAGRASTLNRGALMTDECALDGSGHPFTRGRAAHRGRRGAPLLRQPPTRSWTATSRWQARPRSIARRSVGTC